MKIASISFVLLTLVAGQASASSFTVDEAKEKKELTKIVIADLYDTSFKVSPSEITSSEVLKFNVSSYGANLKTYGSSWNYIEIAAKIKLSLKRGGESCDAVINVKKVTKSSHHDNRVEYLFSADEWPYCLK